MLTLDALKAFRAEAEAKMDEHRPLLNDLRDKKVSVWDISGSWAITASCP